MKFLVLQALRAPGVFPLTRPHKGIPEAISAPGMLYKIARVTSFSAFALVPRGVASARLRCSSARLCGTSADIDGARQKLVRS